MQDHAGDAGKVERTGRKVEAVKAENEKGFADALVNG